MSMYSDLEQEYKDKVKRSILDALLYGVSTFAFVAIMMAFILSTDTSSTKDTTPKPDYSIAESYILNAKTADTEQVIIKPKSSDVYMEPPIKESSRIKFDEMVEDVEKKQADILPLNLENPFENVQYQVIPNMTSTNLSNEEYDILLRIVEAEAGGEDALGKRLVSYTILNRVSSKRFPNTIKDVVFATNSKGGYQYTPISNGRYFSVTPSDSTKRAVDEAINNYSSGIDESEGSTFFMAPHLVGVDTSATANGVKWQQDNLTFVMQHGTHEFRKYPNE